MIGLRRVFLCIIHSPRKACQSNATAQTHPAPRIRSRFAAQWVLAIRLLLICTTDAGARVKPPTVVPHFPRRFMLERPRVQTASRYSLTCRAMIGLRRGFLRISARFESERLRVQTASRYSLTCRAMIGLRRGFLRISHLPRKACQSNAAAQMRTDAHCAANTQPVCRPFFGSSPRAKAHMSAPHHAESA